MKETPSAAIVSILHQHNDPGLTSFLSPSKTLPSSLHRPLLPDMSSSRNLLPPRVPDHLPCIGDLITPDDDDKEERSGFEVLHYIQEDKTTMNNNNNNKKIEDRDYQWPGEFDIWSSIMSQKRSQWSESETKLSLPYVHPLVRRSSSCLSDKSLEICTESLGSESGSDCYSSFPLPGMGSDHKKDGKNEGFFPAAFCPADVEQDLDDQPSFHARSKNKERPRSFPPPLPSLFSSDDGTSVQMRSRREDGRLVLEAVSVPYQKNFRALRENGRLVLVFTAPDTDHCDCDYVYDQLAAEQEVTDVVESVDDDMVEEEGIEWIIGEKVESRVEIAGNSPNIDYIGKHEIPKIAILMNKPNKVREVLFFKGIDGGEVKIDPLPIKANPVNVCDYFWWTITSGTTESAITDHSETTHQLPPNTDKERLISRNDSNLGWSDQREMQVMLKDYTKRMEDCWVSVMRDSNRRSLFLPGATLHCHVMT